MESSDTTPDDAAEVCAYCGDEIDSSEWHPVRATHDEGGEFRIYALCSEECLEEWE